MVNTITEQQLKAILTQLREQTVMLERIMHEVEINRVVLCALHPEQVKMINYEYQKKEQTKKDTSIPL